MNASTANEQGPKIDLTMLFLSISSAAFLGLGIMPDGAGTDQPADRSRIDLPLARQNIDLLELLQEKTRGNRNEEEDQLLEQLLFELRLKYVEVERSLNKDV